MNKSDSVKDLKVLWVTNLPSPYRLPIWNHLAKKVSLNVIFTLKEQNWRNWPSPQNVDWHFEYLSLWSKRIGEFALVPSMFGIGKRLKGIDCVVVGGWESPIFIRVMLSARIRRINIIQFYESTLESHRFNNGLINLLRKVIFSMANVVVTPGSSSSRAVLAMGIHEKRIETLFNPVDVKWFQQTSSNMINETQDMSITGHKFLFVGRLVLLKNIEELIRAFAQIYNKEDILTIAGQGDLLMHLMQITSDLKVTNNVRFIGHQSATNLAYQYATHQTLILPSTNEVWGLVVNEALACGCQVIVSNKCGSAEFVKKMKGVQICATNSSDIAEKMAKSRKNWNGRISEPEILQYTPEKFADKLLKVIQNF